MCDPAVQDRSYEWLWAERSGVAQDFAHIYSGRTKASLEVVVAITRLA